MTIKSKGLIISAMVPLLSAGLIIGVASARNNNNFDITAVQAEKLAVRDEGGATPGNAFYVLDYTWEDNYSKQWYVGNGRNVWAHFWNTADDTKSADVNLGNSITFSYDYDYHARRVVEGRVPEYPDGVTSWNRVLLVRVDASYDHIVWPGDDSAHASDQTSNITLSNSKTINGIRVNATSDVAYDKYVSAAGRIEKWATGENQWNTSGLCVQDGSTNNTALKTSWDATALTYAAIKGDDVKAYFSNLVKNESGSTVEQLAYRYDHILSKNPSWDNFAHR